MLDATAPVLAKKTRGLFCPRCRSANLPVLYSKLPCAGLRIRYRQCAGCGCKIVTREVIKSWTYPLPPNAKELAAKVTKACRQARKTA